MVISGFRVHSQAGDARTSGFNLDAFTVPGQFEVGLAPHYAGTLRNRINTITQQIWAQLRAEFFYMTNTPTLGMPTRGGQVTLGSGAFGTLNQSSRPRGQVQIALNLMF